MESSLDCNGASITQIAPIAVGFATLPLKN